jgi:hypothetical protein
MHRDFDTVMKDMTVSSVHTPTAIGNEKSKGKAKPFKAVMAENNIEISKRDLHPNGDPETPRPRSFMTSTPWARFDPTRCRGSSVR